MSRRLLSRGRYRRLHALCSHVAGSEDGIGAAFGSSPTHLSVSYRHATATTLSATGNSGRRIDQVLRLGVVGLDSSHGVGFARELNSASSSDHNARIVGCVQHGTGYKGGPVIDAMRENLAKHAEEMAGIGAPCFHTVAELLDQVDAVFLTSWDGRVR
eukprot:COSAG02_NODE_624_length_19387_cov_90.736002_16_plen_158_part_00